MLRGGPVCYTEGRPRRGLAWKGSPMNDNTTVPLIVDTLKNLPAHTALSWCDMHQKLAPGIHSASWVDVFEPTVCEAAGIGWAWTINNPTSWDPAWGAMWTPEHPATIEGATQIALTPNRSVWGVIDPEGYGGELLPEPRVVTGFDLQPDPASQELLETVAREVGSTIDSRTGWTSDAINTVLRQWVTAFAHRPDLTFIEDENQTQPRNEALKAVIERLDAGEEETYQLGERVTVASSALDTLLSLDPADSAEIMSTINELTEQLHNGENTTPNSE